MTKQINSCYHALYSPAVRCQISGLVFGRIFNMGYVNQLGSGIPRMIRLLQAHSGRTPDFEVGSAQFLVRL